MVLTCQSIGLGLMSIEKWVQSKSGLIGMEYLRIFQVVVLEATVSPITVTSTEVVSMGVNASSDYVQSGG